MQILTTHRNTDLDALASLVAVALLYPQALPVLPRHVNANVKGFLSIHKDMFPLQAVEDIDLGQVTHLTVVDVSCWERLEPAFGALRGRGEVALEVWDHHLPPGDIECTCGCQEECGATVTLLVRQLKQHRIRLTPVHATLLLCGLYEDTGHLTFPGTRAEDARAAAYLLEQRADLNVLATVLRPAYGEKQKNTLFAMLGNALRTRMAGHSVSISRVQLVGHVDGLALVVRMYREILNVEVAFGIFSQSERNSCIVIGRSGSEALDIGALMRALGGGGHPGAGSAMLKGVNPEAVEEMIEGLICGNQQASVQISDLMSFPVVSVSPEVPMSQVAQILRERGITGMPVVDGEQLVGVISQRDFKKIKKSNRLAAPVKAYMNGSPLTIAPGLSPTHASRLMVKHDVGRLPVVEHGRIIGIISRSDIMRYFYDTLPD